MSETLIRCPFCGIPLKLVGSKRRGNQHYLHEYNNNCILNGFGFIATDENIQHWNTRKPLERIVERLEEELHPDKECFDFEDDYIYAEGRHNKYIEIVKEEGGVK